MGSPLAMVLARRAWNCTNDYCAGAVALFIQKPEFQTIKCAFVRLLKTGKTPNASASVTVSIYNGDFFSVDFQGAEEKCVCAVKE